MTKATSNNLPLFWFYEQIDYKIKTSNMNFIPQKTIELNIGISQENRQELSGMLNALLADEMLLYIKTKNFHWNVKGVHFTEYHELFDEQATAILPNIDNIAERVRALGFPSAGSMQEYLQITHLKENTQRGVKSMDMISRLLNDYETVIRHLREGADKASEQYHDEGTNDFLIGLMKEHEKTAWMLRSHLEE